MKYIRSLITETKHITTPHIMTHRVTTPYDTLRHFTTPRTPHLALSCFVKPTWHYHWLATCALYGELGRYRFFACGKIPRIHIWCLGKYAIQTVGFKCFCQFYFIFILQFITFFFCIFILGIFTWQHITTIPQPHHRHTNITSYSTIKTPSS